MRVVIVAARKRLRDRIVSIQLAYNHQRLLTVCHQRWHLLLGCTRVVMLNPDKHWGYVIPTTTNLTMEITI